MWILKRYLNLNNVTLVFCWRHTNKEWSKLLIFTSYLDKYPLAAVICILTGNKWKLSSLEQRVTYMKTNMHFLSHFLSVLLIMRTISTSLKENRKTHKLLFLFQSCVPDIVSKNIAEPDRPHLAIWHKRIECWTTKTTSTHSEYVILTAFPPQQWLHQRASMLRYMYIACLVDFM